MSIMAVVSQELKKVIIAPLERKNEKNKLKRPTTKTPATKEKRIHSLLLISIDVLVNKRKNKNRRPKKGKKLKSASLVIKTIFSTTYRARMHKIANGNFLNTSRLNLMLKSAKKDVKISVLLLQSGSNAMLNANRQRLY
ncbi:hypothetical protein GCM10011412_12730 [Maribacter cobaltidurans]|nr:hypothetical protein GCM10011412_12730 [Maribacter cobaltidurans]